MKDSLLLIMTPNMSLRKWQAAGFLSRELDYYEKLCAKANLKLIVYSYGRDEKSFVNSKPFITVLQMPNWIPTQVPFKIQNVIYHLISPILFYKTLKKVSIAKTNQFAASFFGLMLKYSYRMPLIIRMGYYYTHVKKRSRTFQFFEYVAFQLCNSILTTSTEAGSYIKNAYRINENKIYAIRNSIDLHRFKPIAILKKYDVLFVGRLEKVKNIEILVAFLQQTLLKVLVIGNGALAPLMEAAVAENDNVTWFRRVDNTELPNYYNQCKVYMIISSIEGNPKSLLEIMACGIPSVGTNVAGTRECIINDVSGFLIEQKLNQLLIGVERLLANPERSREMALNAREWVLQECDMDKNISKEVTLYSTLLGKINS